MSLRRASRRCRRPRRRARSPRRRPRRARRRASRRSPSGRPWRGGRRGLALGAGAAEHADDQPGDVGQVQGSLAGAFCAALSVEVMGRPYVRPGRPTGRGPAPRRTSPDRRRAVPGPGESGANAGSRGAGCGRMRRMDAVRVALLRKCSPGPSGWGPPGGSRGAQGVGGAARGRTAAGGHRRVRALAPGGTPGGRGGLVGDAGAGPHPRTARGASLGPAHLAVGLGRLAAARRGERCSWSRPTIPAPRSWSGCTTPAGRRHGAGAGQRRAGADDHGPRDADRAGGRRAGPGHGAAPGQRRGGENAVPPRGVRAASATACPVWPTT